MANLGNLWFELLLKDNTQVGINAAMKRLQNLRADVKLGVDSNVMGAAVQRALNAKQYVVKVNPVIQSTKKLSLQIDDRAIQNGIRKAIEGQAYRAKVEVIIDKASVSKAVREAFNRAGMNYNTSAGDVRSQRILEIQARMAQNAAIAQEKLRAAHERASRAAQLNANSQNRHQHG